jgi:hypothetical protein
VPATPFQFAFFCVSWCRTQIRTTVEPGMGNASREYRGRGGQLAGPDAAAFHDMIAEIRDPPDARHRELKERE